MTVGLDVAAVEDVLGSGLFRCPVVDCGSRSRVGAGRGRVVRGAASQTFARASARYCAGNRRQ